MPHKYLLAPLTALLLLAAAPRLAQAQTTPTGGVGIGTSGAPDNSAALEIKSSTKGLLPPRLSQAQRDAMGTGSIAAPAPGLTIYNTTTNKLNTWNGTSWDAALSATEQPYQNATQTYTTPGQYSYTVPAGVLSLQVDATGAAGGNNGGSNNGGAGARVQATLAVSPGETLTLYVGGAGQSGGGYNGGGNGSSTSGYRGGGGGGASDVRRSATAPSTALADRLLVAAGGGGAGYSGGGGAGGAPNGATGGAYSGATPGTGATQTAGGSVNGALGQGGSAPATTTAGGGNVGGGGGGGYYGGGGASFFGGGGGGSSLVMPSGSSNLTLTAGAGTGNGSITLTPGIAYAAPTLSGANFVNVPGDNLGNHTATQNLNLAANKLVGNGGTSGLSISSAGVVTTDANLNLGTNALVGTTAVNVGSPLNLGANQLVGNGGTSGLAIASTGAITTAGALTTGGALVVNGSAKATGLAGSGTRMVITAADGTLGSQALPTDAQQLSISGSTISLTNGGTVTVPGDNLGNHTATQALNLGTNALLGNGASIGTVVGVGVRADGGLNLGQSTTGSSIYLGYQAGAVNTGTRNQFSGYQSGYNNTSGNDNVFSGYQSGYYTTTGNQNQFSGTQSGFFNTSGSDNLFSGYQSGYRNTTGSANQFSGTQSGYRNTSGSNNLFGGYSSGGSNTTGSRNVFLGYLSGNANTAGNDNQFSGNQSGYGNTTGYYNTFSGSQSGYNNTTGSTNTALGYNSGPDSNHPALTNATALGANVSLTTSNTLILGNGANVGIGTSSPGHPLVVQADGSNRLLGFNDASGTDRYNFSRQAATTGSGATPGGLNLSESNVAGGRLFVQDGGNVGIGTTNPAGGLHIDRPEVGSTTALGVTLGGGTSGNPSIELRGANNALPYLDFAETSGVDYTTRLSSQGARLQVFGAGTTGILMQVNGGLQCVGLNNVSDRRLKQHIRPLMGGLAAVLALRGVRYEWNPLGVQRGGAAGAGQIGVIAQEVEAIFPELVSTGPDGFKSVNYVQLAPAFIEAFKEQQAQIDALKARAAAAEADHASLLTLQAQMARLLGEAPTAQTTK